MSRLTLEEKVEIVLLCGREGYSLRRVAEVFNTRHANRNVHHSTVGDILNKFKKTGSVMNISHGNNKIERDDEESILANAVANPGSSLTSQALETGKSRSAVRQVLRKNKFKPYKSCEVHVLFDHDHVPRETMCEWFDMNINTNPGFLKSVLFSDESPFKVKGSRNPSHQFFWADKNPRKINPCRQQGSQSVMVWLGMHNERLVGPYFFNGTVTGHSYLQLLQEKLIPDLRAAGEFPTWFQQDGAPPHYSLIVRQYLDQVFPGHWIGRGGFTDWSARLPDLNPLDFAIWPILKDRVYRHEIDSLETLKRRIEEECLAFSAEELNRIYLNMSRRVTLCLDVHGQHFEQLL